MVFSVVDYLSHDTSDGKNSDLVAISVSKFFYKGASHSLKDFFPYHNIFM